MRRLLTPEQKMSITEKQKRHLKKLAHSLKPVVMVGQNGLTDGVYNELDAALETHELVKVRINAGDREERMEMLDGICKKTGSVLVQRIGHVAIFFRRNPKKPKIVIPAI